MKFGEGIKICPNCKTENRQQAKFCKECQLDLTKVLVEKIKKPGEKEFPVFKVIAGIISTGIILILILYLFTNITADKAKKTVRQIIALEKEISFLDNNITKKYSGPEINQAKSFLIEAKKSLDRNDHASSVEWLNQAEVNIKLAKEKEKKGRENDYELYMNKGKEYSQKGDWDNSINSYQQALKYKQDDTIAKKEIENVQNKKIEAKEEKREGYFIGKYKIIEPIEGEKVVIDTKTKLMWVWNGNLAGRVMNWKDAIYYCKNLKYAGYTDWRLPEIEELKTLIKKDERPRIDNKAFDCRDSWYWSVTEYAPYTTFAMLVNFYNGTVINNDKTLFNYVRCVRAGP